MKWQALALLALLASAACIGSVRAQEAEEEADDELEEDERARVLVRRIVADKKPLEGKDTTITIELYNAGNIPATDVKVVEGAWPEDGYLPFGTTGELTASFDSIPVGTSVRHSYVVTPKIAGVYTKDPVTVTYVAEAEADAEQQVTTSQELVFRSYSFGDSLTEQAVAWGATLTNGLLTTSDDWIRATYVIGFTLSAYFGLKYWNTYQESSKAKRRKQAEAELMGETSKTK